MVLLIYNFWVISTLTTFYFSSFYNSIRVNSKLLLLLTFIQAATGEVVSAEELGGAMMHSRLVNKNLMLGCNYFFIDKQMQ